MVRSDFPLLLLDPGQHDAYRKVVDWLLRDETQRKLVERTWRRPVGRPHATDLRGGPVGETAAGRRTRPPRRHQGERAHTCLSQNTPLNVTGVPMAAMQKEDVVVQVELVAGRIVPNRSLADTLRDSSPPAASPRCGPGTASRGS